MILVLICKSIGFTSQKYNIYIATVYLLHRNSIPFTPQKYYTWNANVPYFLGQISSFRPVKNRPETKLLIISIIQIVHFPCS